MAWWKKAILFILSTIVFVFTSCENSNSLSEEKQDNQEKSWTKEEIIANFFFHVQQWNPYSISVLDSLGNAISQKDSSLHFLPYGNEYEQNAFVFAANNKNDFHDFEESEFIKNSIVSQHPSYKVWRKKINQSGDHGIQVLDLSIEPHPTLHWIFVVRLRKQE